MTHHLSDAPAAGTTTDARPHARFGWLPISGLLALSALPIIGGALSLRKATAPAADAFAWASTVAMVAHIVSMSVFCVVGAFQFSPVLRGRRRWHRTAGRVLLPLGFVAAVSGAWLAIFFGGPAEELPLAMVRLFFSAVMLVFLAMSVIAILGRDFTAHGSWSTRAFAIAASGGTQALVSILWTIPFGEPDASGETWVVGAGFVINCLIAEVIIRRRASVAAKRSAERSAKRSAERSAGRGALVS